MRKSLPCAAECRRQLTAAAELAFHGKYIDAALVVLHVRPEYARRLLFMAAGMPLEGHQDYWAEPCAWDVFGDYTPPMVVCEMRTEASRARLRIKKMREFLRREKKRAVKAAFKQGT